MTRHPLNPAARERAKRAIGRPPKNFFYFSDKLRRHGIVYLRHKGRAVAFEIGWRFARLQHLN